MESGSRAPALCPWASYPWASYPWASYPWLFGTVTVACAWVVLPLSSAAS
jgi:hypothetical protein